MQGLELCLYLKSPLTTWFSFAIRRMCRDSQFFSESFGGGISETESEEEEEDPNNAATPTPQGGTDTLRKSGRRRMGSGDLASRKGSYATIERGSSVGGDRRSGGSVDGTSGTAIVRRSSYASTLDRDGSAGRKARRKRADSSERDEVFGSTDELRIRRLSGNDPLQSRLSFEDRTTRGDVGGGKVVGAPCRVQARGPSYSTGEKDLGCISRQSQVGRQLCFLNCKTFCSYFLPTSSCFYIQQLEL